MRTGYRTLLMASVMALVGLAAGAADTGEQAERARLAGTWHGFAVTGKGETSDRGPVEVRLRITEEAIAGKQLQDGKEVDHGVGAYVLDFGKTPRVLDATKTRPTGGKELWRGIYTLEGDTLKWCVRLGERPTEFETKAGAFLVIVKRAKPAGAAERAR